MYKAIQRVANKIALPFNAVAFVGVSVRGWFTYQESGFTFYVWLPIALTGIGLILIALSKRT